MTQDYKIAGKISNEINNNIIIQLNYVHRIAMNANIPPN